jgi:hypothetical protein
MRDRRMHRCWSIGRLRGLCEESGSRLSALLTDIVCSIFLRPKSYSDLFGKRGSGQGHPGDPEGHYHFPLWLLT